MVRVLVTVEPRMYREALALAIQRDRPDAEVILVSDDLTDGWMWAFRPHMLVRNGSDAAVPEELLGGVVCRVEILFTDGLAAVITVGERSYRIEDASMVDLLALVDEAEGLASTP